VTAARSPIALIHPRRAEPHAAVVPHPAPRNSPQVRARLCRPVGPGWEHGIRDRYPATHPAHGDGTVLQPWLPGHRLDPGTRPEQCAERVAVLHFPGGKEQLAVESVTVGATELRAVIESVFVGAVSAQAAVDQIAELFATSLEGSGFTQGCRSPRSRWRHHTEASCCARPARSPTRAGPIRWSPSSAGGKSPSRTGSPWPRWHWPDPKAHSCCPACTETSPRYVTSPSTSVHC
jgi:hypothetical protein